MQDRNFDDLVTRFQRNVYGTLKGQLRLRVLQRDFKEFIPELEMPAQSWNVLDAGAGQGQFTLPFANHGNRVVLADISSKMLAVAEQHIEQMPPESRNNIHVLNTGICRLPEALAARKLPSQYDLVVCHAVLEWLAHPDGLYKQLQPLVKPGGYLSLIFYNINGLAFKNLLRTNFSKFDIDNFKSFRGSLTPIHPQNPVRVEEKLIDAGFEVLCRSGIRVFHDFILNPQERNRSPEALSVKELDYSRRAPFWQMARYIHYLARSHP